MKNKKKIDRLEKALKIAHKDMDCASGVSPSQDWTHMLMREVRSFSVKESCDLAFEKFFLNVAWGAFGAAALLAVIIGLTQFFYSNQKQELDSLLAKTPLDISYSEFVFYNSGGI